MPVMVKCSQRPHWTLCVSYFDEIPNIIQNIVVGRLDLSRNYIDAGCHSRGSQSYTNCLFIITRSVYENSYAI